MKCWPRNSGLIRQAEWQWLTVWDCYPFLKSLKKCRRRWTQQQAPAALMNSANRSELESSIPCSIISKGGFLLGSLLVGLSLATASGQSAPALAEGPAPQAPPPAPPVVVRQVPFPERVNHPQPKGSTLYSIGQP